MSREAMKLALEKFAKVKELCDKHGDKINRKHVYGGALIEHFDVVCQALAEQPAQQEPLGFMNAGNILEMQQKSLPYAYVYPVKSTGVSVAVYTSPQAQRKPLTDEQRSKMYRAAQMRGDSIMLRSDYEQGITDTEAAHNIKEKP